MKKNEKGVSLIEMLLVLVVLGMILVMINNYYQTSIQQQKYDRASVDIQQILSAASSYYMLMNKWPSTLACLDGVGGSECTVKFLSGMAAKKNPWGQPYSISSAGVNLPFYVHTLIGGRTLASARAQRRTMIGIVPMGAVGTGAPQVLFGQTYLPFDASINTPAKALWNNRGQLNFAGIYHHGGCVPVPQCPPNTTPQVFVVPTQIVGAGNSSGNYAMDISNFSSYATGPAAPNAVPNCYSLGGIGPACVDGGSSTAAQYWRVCASVLTPAGYADDINPNSWGQAQALMAVTRCSPNVEKTGSGFNIYTQ